MSAIAYHFEPGSDLAGLTSASQQVPEPGPGQIVIRVHAAAVNRRDLMIVEGTSLPATPGVVPLADGVGDVVAIGSGVVRAAVGDRVTSTFYVSWTDGPMRVAEARDQYGLSHDGMLANYAVLEEESVVHVPEHLSDEEAASLATAGVTAWSALTAGRPVLPGQNVLVVGAGSVGQFAVQFAHILGARVIVIGSTARAEFLRGLGADEVIDHHTTHDWENVVRELTGGDGVDHVIETVGPRTFANSRAAAALNGAITIIGMFQAADDDAVQDPFQGRPLTIRHLNVGSRAEFEAMNEVIAKYQLHVAIDRVFPLEQAVEAYRYLREGKPVGKVVITMQ
ncbi:zinc-dependent alcohol dehydrogenase family protein [Nocardia iowensis]|uniref:NAD(P)-dependent alcohol dehydrogenase n=1 Tax=Nocardia iowensis TaxID=204891 RepID=A0ABX8RW95_NOCIO|nr:NAD(P)-dependent alcohol dehydrogenase [Nocardia iowensis]QXN93237.1 NAD(P)-dependent alcohol dehydrogenase [Nocardia iowensis]